MVSDRGFTRGLHLQFQFERVRLLVIGVFALAATLFTFRDLIGASFTGDDWHYLALFRYIDSPADIFTSNIAATYLYRPVALFVFWLSERAFGIQPTAHYGLNIALHIWVALEVFFLSKATTQRSTLSAWTAAFFLVFPATAATPLWISDRFDLIATAAVLCSLRCMLQWASSAASTQTYLWASALAALIALGSKEVAFALAPSLLLLLALLSERSRSNRLLAAGLMAATVTAALLFRLLALGGWKGDESLSLNFATVASGIQLWVTKFPIAVQTHNGHLALTTVVAVVMLAYFFRRDRPLISVDRQRMKILAILFSLLVGVVVVQSPIAAVALKFSRSPLDTASLRFYYAALAVAFVSAAVLIGAFLRQHNRFTGVTQCIAALALAWCALQSSAQSNAWATATRIEQDRSSSALLEYFKRSTDALQARPCIVRLPAEMAGGVDLDLRFKASLPYADPRVDCAVITDPPQAQTITRLSTCNAEKFLPARSTVPALQPLVRSGTCTFFFLGL